MWRSFSLTALLVVCFTTCLSDCLADDTKYLMNNASRRGILGGQPVRGSQGGVGFLPGAQTRTSKRTEKVFSSPAPPERTTRSDWEIVQEVLGGEDFPFHWKTHRGKPEECLALVRVHHPEGMQTFNALVVRCDGFLMAPQAVWDAVKNRVRVDVVVTQAEGEASTGPFPVLVRNPVKPRQKHYHFVKVNGHHLRCLPVLAFWNVVKGTPVRLIWMALDGDGKTLLPQSVEAICEEPSADRTVSECALTFKPGTQPTKVPHGTLVVDTESGAAVGMIPDGNQPRRFASTRHFGDIFADVALAPTRDAARGKAPPQNSALVGSMVKVPGGPVIFDSKEFVNAYQTAIACTPDFYCDKYLTTIGEW